MQHTLTTYIHTYIHTYIAEILVTTCHTICMWYLVHSSRFCMYTISSMIRTSPNRSSSRRRKSKSSRRCGRTSSVDKGLLMLFACRMVTIVVAGTVFKVLCVTQTTCRYNHIRLFLLSLSTRCTSCMNNQWTTSFWPSCCTNVAQSPMYRTCKWTPCCVEKHSL